MHPRCTPVKAKISLGAPRDSTVSISIHEADRWHVNKSLAQEVEGRGRVKGSTRDADMLGGANSRNLSPPWSRKEHREGGRSRSLKRQGRGRGRRSFRGRRWSHCYNRSEAGGTGNQQGPPFPSQPAVCWGHSPFGRAQGSLVSQREGLRRPHNEFGDEGKGDRK